MTMNMKEVGQSRNVKEGEKKETLKRAVLKMQTCELRWPIAFKNQRRKKQCIGEKEAIYSDVKLAKSW